MANIKELLGRKIREIRKSKGFSQMQLAEMLDISTNALSTIETGNGFLTAETLEKILCVFGLEADELFSFGTIKTNKEIYNSIIKNLDLIKNNQGKLSVIDKIVKIIL